MTDNNTTQLLGLMITCRIYISIKENIFTVKMEMEI